MGSELDRDVQETLTAEGGFFIFARFEALPGCGPALEAALRDVLAPTRAEEGNLAIDVFRVQAEEGTFYVHSRWRDEAAFDAHAGLPHTKRFIERAAALTGGEVRVARTARLV